MTSAPANPAVSASVAAERALLGAAMLDADAATAVLAAVAVADLELPRHRTIYSAIAAAHEDTGDASPLGVAAVLEHRRRIAEIGGTGTLLDMATEAADLAGRERIAEHARIIREAADRRWLVAAIGEAHVAAQRGADPDELRARLGAVATPVLAAAAGPTRLRDWREVAAEPAPPMLLQGLLPSRSIAMMVGAPNTGKSTIAVGWARAIARGEPWCGRDVLAGPVIYVAGEGARGIAARAMAYGDWSGGSQADHGLVIADGLPPLSGPDGIAELRRIIDAATEQYGARPVLVIVDTLSVHWAESEDRSECVGPCLAALRRIAEAGTSIALLHHPRKPTERPTAAADAWGVARGSGAWVGGVDAVLYLGGRPDDLRLATLKQRDYPRGDEMPLRLEARAGSVVAVPGAAQPVQSDAAAEAAQNHADAESLARVAVTVLRDLGGTTPSKESIYARMSGKTARKRAAVADAIGRGWIAPEGRNDARRYVLTDAGRVCVCAPPYPQGRGGAAAHAAPAVAPTVGAARGGEGRRGDA